MISGLRFYRLFVLLWCVLCPIHSMSHHSRTEFSSEVRILEGLILSVHWRNPHPRIALKVLNDSDQEEIWEIKAWGAANLMNRLGVTGDLLKVGDYVKIAGQASTRREYYLQGTNVLLPSGLELIMQPTLMPRWSPQRFVGNRARHFELVGENKSQLPVDTASGIFRVWTANGSDAGPTRLPLTASSEEKKRNWNPETDDPALRCEPPGMPGAMSTPHPMAFEQQGDDIILLHLEEWDLTRTIHMTPRANTENDSSTLLGYSVGYWEDSTLVVVTRKIDYPYSIRGGTPRGGTPQSKRAEIVERFNLGVDHSTLDWEATISDPETFTEPVTAGVTHWKWVPGEKIQPYNCSIGPG